VLVQPRLARAQAEELPPELAGEQNAPSPIRPSQASGQPMAVPQPTSQAVPTGSFRVFTSSNEPFGAHHTMGLLAAVLL
jgi:hypothetical protein